MANWNIITLDDWEVSLEGQPGGQGQEAGWKVEKEGNKDTSIPMLTLKQFRDSFMTRMIRDIRASIFPAKKVSEHAFRQFPCAKCRGTGRDDLLRTRCAVCLGKGKVSIRKPAIKCAYCGGRGTQHPNERLTTCIVCNGRGMVSIKEPVGKCASCRGTGKDDKFNSYCGVCNGKGVVTAKEIVK